MPVPKLLNENPMRYLSKLLGLKGKTIKLDNVSVYRLPTSNMSYITFLELLKNKLDYLRPNKLISNEEVGPDFIKFTLNTTSPFNQVCVSEKTGIEVFTTTDVSKFKRK